MQFFHFPLVQFFLSDFFHHPDAITPSTYMHTSIHCNEIRNATFETILRFIYDVRIVFYFPLCIRREREQYGSTFFFRTHTLTIDTSICNQFEFYRNAFHFAIELVQPSVRSISIKLISKNFKHQRLCVMIRWKKIYWNSRANGERQTYFAFLIETYWKNSISWFDALSFFYAIVSESWHWLWSSQW